MQVRIINQSNIDWRKAIWFQPKGLKTFVSDDAKNALRQSLIENGFVLPFNVWRNGNDIFILDGHHRQIVLDELAKEGIVIPDYLPANFVDCKNKKEAAKLVVIYSSFYTKVENAGLAELLKMNEIPINTKFFDGVKLPEFSLPRFSQKFFELPSFEKAIDTVAIKATGGDLLLNNKGIPKMLGNDEVEQSPKDETSKSPNVVDSAEPTKPNNRHTTPLIEIPDRDFGFQIGDVVLLNDRHIVACGDYAAIDWQHIIDTVGKVPNMLLTDPPYNLAANYIGQRGEVKHGDFEMAAGEMSDAEFTNFLRKIMNKAVEITCDGSLHYLFMDFRHVNHITNAAFTIYGSVIPKQICVWNKSIPGMGSFYRQKHEFCFIFKNGKVPHKSNIGLKDRIRNNVWDYPSAIAFNNDDRSEIRHHPTPKTVAMLCDAILDVTDTGDVVVDFFGGSGSTLIAAEMTERVCIMSELEEKYFNHILNRYMQYCEKAGIGFDVKKL